MDEMATVRRFLSDQLIAARNHARHAELPAMRTSWRGRSAGCERT
ncbi:MAG: hypothetical protein WDN04_14435 [Rhodospirillales bacterium]